MIYGWCVQAHWPEENSKFGSTAGWLFALKGYGGLVWSLQALLHFFQHALVDGRPLIGWSDFMHASECGCLPLAAACVHWGEVNCLTSNWIFNVQAMEKSSFLKKKKRRLIIKTQHRAVCWVLSYCTIDVKGVAVLWTLISTLAEEIHHLFCLSTKY